MTPPFERTLPVGESTMLLEETPDTSPETTPSPTIDLPTLTPSQKKNQRRKAKIRQMKEEHRDFVEGRAPRSSESDVGAQIGSPSQAEAVRQAAGEATQQLVQQRIKDQPKLLE
ncbi:hypothetical protein V5O48_013755 [Marasmius crinis-equi]|uniref:Uncharacterized protein n=1 Tax=Marasmius crinis-equi TaxID=585013 RepID=A0ABR3EZA8_9AGAR